MGLIARNQDPAMSLTNTAPEASSAFGLAAKATPPVAVTGAQLAGMPVDDWIKWLTLAYLVVILLRTIWQWARDARGGAK